MINLSFTKRSLLFFTTILLIIILYPFQVKAKEKYKEKLISMGEFKITYYCSCEECSGGWGAKTSTGNYCEEGRTVAVDPDVIAYGTRILIDDNEYIADDCGDGVVGDHIDIYVDDHELTEELGVEYKKVWLIKQVKQKVKKAKKNKMEIQMIEDTINRKEAIRSVIKADSYSDVSGEFYRKMDDILGILEKLPSALPTIIKCKDCKRYVKSEGATLKKCSLLNFYPTEDWYCAGAELERRK